MRENRRQRDGRRRRPVGGRSSWGCGRKLKLPSPSKDGRRDSGEWANNCQRMRDLKGRNIGALVDGERVSVAVVSGKSEKSRIVPLGNVSRRRVKIPIDVILVPRKGGENKNLGTGERHHRRGGGRSIRRRGGGREERPRRWKISKRIHNNIVFFFCRGVSGERIATPSRQ